MNFRSYRPGGGILNRPILVVALGLAALPANAQEEAAGLLQRDYANCGEYAETIAATEFKAEPDLFLCHGYDFKGLNLYGFFVFHGRDRFMLHMTTNKHGFCSGMGEQVIVELDDRSHASASGRFDCDDGSRGGFAYEVDFITEQGVEMKLGTIFGGIDGHAARNNEDDRISADFYVFDRNAILQSLKNR